MRIVMLGTGDFALPTFEHLCDLGLGVVALITQPDRPQGRKQEIIPSAIRRSAEARGVRVEQPESINGPEGLDLVRSLAPDLLVTAAYGQILSADLLGIPRLGGINLHGSILPRYRGAAPVARAIEAGEAETGVTVIRMSPRVDAGGMLSFARTPIDPDETAGELEARLANLGVPLIPPAIAALVEGSATILPQDPALVTRAPKLRKESGRIDWTKPVRTVHNLVRAMQPWPSASTLWTKADGAEPVRLIVHQTEVVDGSGEPGRVIEGQGSRVVVACGEGAVRLVRVQLEGKKAMTPEEFVRGYRPSGTRMGG